MQLKVNIGNYFFENCAIFFIEILMKIVEIKKKTFFFYLENLIIIGKG